jgi:segregation and condensation protein B
MDFLQNHIEALIFCSQESVKVEEIRQCLSEMFEAEVPVEDIEAALDGLIQKYEPEIYPFQIYRIGGGYQFLTKPAYQSSLSIFLKQKSKKRLSTSALETIAIVAYKQPITKSQIEQIRGVNCDYAIQKLLEKELVEIKGKSDGVGRPVLYGTSDKFMEYFGINDLKDLPHPKEFTKDENSIGEETEDDFDPLVAALAENIEIENESSAPEELPASEEMGESEQELPDSGEPESER